MTDSLNPFLRKKKAQDLEKLSRYTIDNDRWDRKEFDNLLRQIPELSVARRRLADNIAGDLGYDEAADVIWMLNKITPHPLDEAEIRPSRLVNRRVNEEVAKLDEYQRVRRWTPGEPVAAALAFEQMEPDIEILYDRLQDAMERQKEYEQALKDALQAQQDEQSAEEMIKQWEETEAEEQDGDGDGEPQQVPVELAEALQEAQQGSADAQAQAQAAMAALQQTLDGAGSAIRSIMGEALAKADDNLDQLNEMAHSWGQELRDLIRLPAAKRMELAKRLSTPKFAAMSKLIGPAIREAFAQQKRKVVQIPEAIVDMTVGDDLPRVIPPELARLDDEDTEMLFLKDLVEHNLVQYEMKGTEKIARGGIIYIHDGSGSMAGPREIWAKAIGLALLHVAKRQKRSFYGIQFGSRGQIRIDDFRDTRRLDPAKVIDFAEFFYNGGTDFQSPLNHAMDILKKEHAEFGAVQADIVFATDGCAGVTPDFMKTFKELQRKLDVTVWGVAIAGGPSGNIREAGLQPEPLSTICDGKVATVDSILNAKDISEVFRGL